jgi:hypothetical protein
MSDQAMIPCQQAARTPITRLNYFRNRTELKWRIKSLKSIPPKRFGVESLGSKQSGRQRLIREKTVTKVADVCTEIPHSQH